MSKPKYFSAEAREKIAATHRGRKQSPEQVAKRVEQCGRRCNRDGRGFHCHHLASYGAHPERRYDVENGVLYCGPCHRALHAVANKGAGRPAKGGQE